MQSAVVVYTVSIYHRLQVFEPCTAHARCSKHVSWLVLQLVDIHTHLARGCQILGHAEHMQMQIAYKMQPMDRLIGGFEIQLIDIMRLERYQTLRHTEPCKAYV